ncbi:MAG: glycerophosphodiester phosphodiesterase [Acidimicrobiales bacterium]
MRRPLVLGHGSGRAGDEFNSRASFERLMLTDVDGVELDVRRTADDVLAVRHDPHAPDGRLVSATCLAELPADTLTLEQVLDICAGRLVNIEIKSFPQDPDHDPDERVTELVVDLLAARDQVDRVIVSSFGPACLARVRARAPHLPSAVLLFHPGDPDELLDAVVAGGHRIVHPYEPHVDERFVAAARRRDLAVNVWTVRDDQATLDRLVALDVDGIITGRPDRIHR